MEELARGLEDSIRASITGQPEEAWILDNDPRGSDGADRAPLRHPMLLAGAARSKDQTYFLSGVQTEAEAFGNVLFLLGHLEKGQTSEMSHNGATRQQTVRDIAHAERLPTAAKASLGICFVGECNG